MTFCKKSYILQYQITNNKIQTITNKAMKSKFKIGEKVVVYPNFNTPLQVVGFVPTKVKGYSYVALRLSDGNVYAPHRISNDTSTSQSV